MEQSIRRALRSLERRGLATLESYYFWEFAESGGMSPRIFWSYTHPKNYVPGKGRIMTGVLLTKAGWAIAAEEEAKIAEARAMSKAST